MNVLGLDVGRSIVKVFTGFKYLSFPAVVGEWRDMKIDNSKRGDDWFEGEFRGERFFAGRLAEAESEFCRKMLVDSKSTPDALLLSLIAIHQSNMTDVDIVTGVPFSLHDEVNKAELIKLLTGRWEIVVNGVLRTVNVNRVRVAVEGGGAFWSKPLDGLVRIVDGGSKTINYITMKDRFYVDRDSGTIPFGFDTTKSSDLQQMITSIAGELGKKFGQKDLVLTIGGKASDLALNLRGYFPRVQEMHSTNVLTCGREVSLNLFANAVGYYNIGRTV
jgi:plasmid segregation protein ParM